MRFSKTKSSVLASSGTRSSGSSNGSESSTVTRSATHGATLWCRFRARQAGEALREQFVRDAMARRAQRLRGQRETIGERFERDRAASLPLPAARYKACDKTTARVSSISLVRSRTNDYSVPTQHGHREVLVKAYVHRIVIVAGSEVIAEHRRSYEREAAIYDPLHYVALLEHKSRALDQAAPLAGGQLPECFAQLRRLLEARLRKHAGREYIQVLRLIEHFAFEEITVAVEQALALNAISFDGVRHLVLCRIERRPPRLDTTNWPHLPLAQVRTTRTVDYMSLLSMPAADPLTLEATL